MLLPASRKYPQVSNVRKQEKAVQWRLSLRPATATQPRAAGTTSLKRKRRKEKGFTRQPERARGSERAERGGAGRASAKAKDEERNHQRRMLS
ncbi:unnamed protein product [Sphagnum jensenii]|uniref:Uncharacterized protein n=1 Tax=Sphagnum jensenii TaxID=128206 RepID=A0ABP0WRN8_9BRYO